MRNLFRAVVGAVVVGVLLYISRSNYLLFHSLSEIFAIVIACGVFMITWNSRRFFAQDGLLLIGLAYLFVGIIDIVHALAYKGMGIVGDTGSNTATQLWITARLLESVSLLTAVLMPRRRLKAEIVVAAYTAVTGLLLLAIMVWHVFPACYVEGTGLTTFKRGSEYAVCLMLLAAIVVLLARRAEFDRAVLAWIVASMGLTIASELFFTAYVSVYGPSNKIGHILKIASFYCVYRAIIQTGLRTPFKLLFRELKEAESRYRSLFSHMSDGFAYHEIVTDGSGKAADYVFLEVNDAFERLTGLKREAIIGRCVTEVIPNIASDPADWIGTYGKVALQGEPLRFESYSEELNRWYHISAYSPHKGGFATVFRDVTQRKEMEAALRQRLHETTAQLEARKTELRRAVSELNLAEHRERDRLAHVLHDHLQQLLYAAMLEVTLLKEADDEQRHRNISRVVDLLKETLEETRCLTSDLSPPVLMEGGLADGLAWLSDWMLEKHGLDVELECQYRDNALGEDMRILLFQSVRELLFNVVKHAAVDRAQVRLWHRDGTLCITVSDKGKGFDPRQIWDTTEGARGGFGLRTIRQRLDMAGGSLVVDAEPGRGATFTLAVPVCRHDSIDAPKLHDQK